MTEREEPISLIEAKIAQGEQEARRLLHMLEQAMVRCGYTRDGTYNSRYAKYTGREQRPTVIFWRDGRILLYAQSDSDLPVDEMGVYHLIDVAHNLAPFLDALEGHSRHLVTAIRNACASVQTLIDSINAEPRPSDNPAQMPTE